MITETISLEVTEEGDLIKLDLSWVNKKVIRAKLIGNGQTNQAVVQNSKLSALGWFISNKPEQLAEAFDPVGTLANAIDAHWLTERLVQDIDMLEIDDNQKTDLVGQVGRLSIVNNLMSLYAIGAGLMQAVYGYNWLAEQSGLLIKQSKSWKDLVTRIDKAQKELAAYSPS